MTNPDNLSKPPKSEQFGDWKHYYDTIYSAWDSFRSKRKSYYTQIEQYLTYCIPKGSRVLEIGCSTGIFSMHLSHPLV